MTVINKSLQLKRREKTILTITRFILYLSCYLTPPLTSKTISATLMQIAHTFLLFKLKSSSTMINILKRVHLEIIVTTGCLDKWICTSLQVRYSSLSVVFKISCIIVKAWVCNDHWFYFIFVFAIQLNVYQILCLSFRKRCVVVLWWSCYFLFRFDLRKTVLNVVLYFWCASL